MSEETKDGGPAFPAPVRRFDSKEEALDFDKNGMSLRDYFAGQVVGHAVELFRINGARDAAEFAYKCADAMLAESDKK